MLLVSSRARSPGLAAALAAGAAALAVEVTTHLVDFGVFDLRINVINSNYEWSYSHVLATLALGVGAISCAWGAVLGQEARATRGVASALFALLWLDGVTRVHEHVPVWPAVYAPILISLAASLVAIARGTDRANVVYAGLALLLSSLVIHVLGPDVVHALGWQQGSWAYQIKVALKEGTELAGWVVLVPAVVALARVLPPQRA
jgi:uncharacterized membrane protein YfbV (UPF0208 family)